MDLSCIKSFDKRRHFAIPGNTDTTLNFAVEHFLSLAKDAIAARGAFFVALSGGSTPKAIYEKLADKNHSNRIDWSKVYLFWSDERAVLPTDEESNYHMAMTAGLKELPIRPNHIYRMVAEEDIEANALMYEGFIEEIVPDTAFDLVMLGMGPDGHTASLFPHTQGLEIKNRMVIANHIPQKNTWRMTFTFSLINRAKNIAAYLLGGSKADMVHAVFNGPHQPEETPIQNIGTPERPALFIADEAATKKLIFS